MKRLSLLVAPHLKTNYTELLAPMQLASRNQRPNSVTGRALITLVARPILGSRVLNTLSPFRWKGNFEAD